MAQIFFSRSVLEITVKMSLNLTIQMEVIVFPKSTNGACHSPKRTQGSCHDVKTQDQSKTPVKKRPLSHLNLQNLPDLPLMQEHAPLCLHFIQYRVLCLSPSQSTGETCFSIFWSCSMYTELSFFMTLGGCLFRVVNVTSEQL